MSTHKKYLWVTIESETSEGLKIKCKEKYPGHVIVRESIIRSQYHKKEAYKQVFILRKIRTKKNLSVNSNRLQKFFKYVAGIFSRVPQK